MGDGHDADGGHGVAITNHAVASYAFADVINQVPINQDGTEDEYITCVQYWDANLYVGTSHGQLLHFVSIPPPDESPYSPPEYILASRTSPETTTADDDAHPAINHILLLPAVAKACILCGSTLTFYSLPELSPAFGGKIKQTDCTWVGGIDEDLDRLDQSQSEGLVVVICLRQRLRLIRIGQQARKLRDIELGGCLDVKRRRDLACVADADKYALIDVANQQKVDLFAIASDSMSSLSPDVSRIAPVEYDARNDIRPAITSRPSSRSFSGTAPLPRVNALARGHDRVVSLGAPRPQRDTSPRDGPPAFPARTSSRSDLALETSQMPRPPSPDAQAKPLPQLPFVDRPAIERENDDGSSMLKATAVTPDAAAKSNDDKLKPHIASLGTNEFLLTTGTSRDEPGVGIFVSHEGDVVRGTLEFTTYPESLLLIERKMAGLSSSMLETVSQDMDILAIVRTGKAQTRFLETQTCSPNVLDPASTRQVINLPFPQDLRNVPVLLGRTVSSTSRHIPGVTELLSLRRVAIDTSDPIPAIDDTKREQQEDSLIDRLAVIDTDILLYSADRISWVLPQPTLLRLDAELDLSIEDGKNVNNAIVQRVFNKLRGDEASDELHFHTLEFVRQKAALLLLASLRLREATETTIPDSDLRDLGEVLLSSNIEPRLVLSAIPELRDHIFAPSGGIWVAGGLHAALELAESAAYPVTIALRDTQLLKMLREYLHAWRRKKGFGSISDEANVFRSVDAALLYILIVLDEQTPRGPATGGSVRAELNEVVDRSVECFDHAVSMLRSHKRLYVLSRLYQSRKMGAEVLATWRGIIEGESDAGGELVDGELDVRRYLTRIRDAELFKQYAIWLAKRNPALGVQLFADDSSKVQFTPTEGLAALRQAAPGAVKPYLEHLVFARHMAEYVEELITFHLDTILSELDDSLSTRNVLSDSYLTYRALEAPKPTYREFLTDNAIEEDWFRSRLALLDLIGSAQNATPSSDITNLADRLAPYSELLVPEMIEISARRSQHSEALRLLTLGLGDYDTAVAYCLRGGDSVFGTLSPSPFAPRDQQRKLFRTLLVDAFLLISDLEERRARTCELLDRYGSWFDVLDVLQLLPDDWPLLQIAAFVTNALKKMTSERHEAQITMALCGLQNVERNFEVLEKMDRVGRSIVESEAGIDSAYHSMESRSEGRK